MEKKAAQKQAAQQYANDMAAAQMQRQWQLEDRDEARAYNRAELEESREYSRRVVSDLVADAEKAGFNPLTLLRNGGASNYNAAAGLAPLSSTPLTRQAPVRQAVGGSPIGSAFNAAGDFLRDFDPFADQKREQEYRLVESQISSLNASSLSSPRVTAGARRSYGTADYERRSSGKSGNLSKGNAPGEGKIVGGDDPTVSSMGWRWSNGEHGYFEAPWMPDADVWAKIVGDNELFSTIYSIAKVGNDIGYSGYRNAVAPLSKAKKIKPDAEYRREYFKNIRESVPSLIHK